MLEYLKIRDNITVEAVAEAISKVKESNDLELDDLCHIVIKETNTRVGYIGDESIQLCDYGKKELLKYHMYIIEHLAPAVDEVLKYDDEDWNNNYEDW